MLRMLKQIVLAFKPISDYEAMQMRLDGPQPLKRKDPLPGFEVMRSGSIRFKERTWSRIMTWHGH